MKPLEKPFVQVFPQRRLVDRLVRGGLVGSHLISIGNPAQPGRPAQEDEALPPECEGRFDDVLRLEFFDVPAVEYLLPEQPPRVPELRDAEAVVNFFRRTKDHARGYTVHCWGGISRSTAVAFALLYLIHGSEGAAARELMAIRREAGPHQNLVRFFDEFLGSHLAETNEVLRRERLEAMRREIQRHLDRDLEEL